MRVFSRRFLRNFKGSRADFNKSTIVADRSAHHRFYYDTNTTFYPLIGVATISGIGLASYTLLDDKASCKDLEKVKIGDVSSFKDGEMQEVAVHGGKSIVLISKIKGQFYCTGYSCPHYSASFLDGAITEDYVVCPWHNAKFRLTDGECINGPYYDAIPTYATTIENGVLYAYLPPFPLPEDKKVSMKTCCEKDDRIFVICGAGAAGHAAAETLRKEGFAGRILMYGDEKHLPYYRPHLSKQIETDSYDNVALEQALRPPQFYKDNKIEFFGKKTVKSLNDKDKTIILEDGTTVKYDKVLVATGAEAIQLPFTRGMDIQNLITIRVPEDIAALRKFIKPNANVVIVGANFIGCEIASAMRDSGANITMITDMETPMQNIIGKRAGSAIAKLLTSHNVNLYVNSKVQGYNIDGNRITHVKLPNDKVVEADVVIEGVGAFVRNNIIKCSPVLRNGTVTVDSSFRPIGCKDVFAAGDIVTYPYHINGDNIHVKHWNVAVSHGRVAGKNMMDIPAKMDQVPYFWSDFFHRGFRFAGYAMQMDDILYEGDVDNFKFVAYYFNKEKMPIAVMAMGMPHVGATIAEALERKCIPNYYAIKFGAANSDTMLKCMKKFNT